MAIFESIGLFIYIKGFSFWVLDIMTQFQEKRDSYLHGKF